MKSLTTHIPVMLREVCENTLRFNPKTVLDATFGGGGYSKRILELNEQLVLWVSDRDPEAIQRASILKSGRFRERLYPIQSSFNDLQSRLPSHLTFDAAIFDLGTCSDQISNGQRGFSFREDGPLDMRMDPNTSVTASDIINWYSMDKLTKIISEFGEDPFAGHIARTIVKRRKECKFESTVDLADTILKCVPINNNRSMFVHPATRTFQAIRIVVNDELAQIRNGLEAAFQRLTSGGVIVVVSFHALEDREIKNFIRSKSENEEIKIITKSPLLPSDDEISNNKRSRSAKMRVFRKISL